VHFEQRILPGQTREDVEQVFHSIISQIKESDPEFDASVDVYFIRAPLSTPENETVIKSLKSAYRKHSGKEINHAGGPFWTDAALMSESGIPSILFGSIGEGFHGDIEYVEIDSLVGVTEIIIDTILDYCGVSNPIG
jgi:acetylornithine deacetylase